MRMHRLIGMALCVAAVGFPLMAWSGPAPDTDGDGTPDVLDNCSEVAQTGVEFCDNDRNGYGNVCDFDLSNDGAVNTDDIRLLPEMLSRGGRSPADLNCDGATNSGADIFLIPARLNAGFPGPSGLPCAGTIPCQ